MMVPVLCERGTKSKQDKSDLGIKTEQIIIFIFIFPHESLVSNIRFCLFVFVCLYFGLGLRVKVVFHRLERKYRSCHVRTGNL